MPVIRVEMFAGRTVEQKRALVTALTAAFVDSCGGVPDSVWVVIDDVPKENWGFGGRLGIDPKPGA